MDIVVLDLEALIAAQTALRSCHDTIRSESARHGRLAGDVGDLLRQMASDIFHTLNPASMFDPFGPWEQWGMGRFSWECQTSHSATSDAHREAQRTVHQVALAHSPLGDVIASHAGDAVISTSAAAGKVGDLTSFCGPHNLLWFMEEPWVLVERFHEVESLLGRSADEIVTYVHYLEALFKREEEVIRELLNPYLPARTKDNAGPAYKPALAAQQVETSMRQQIADTATRYGALLTPGASWDVNGETVYDRLDLSKVPVAEREAVANALKFGVWDSKGQDIECVAFCVIVLEVRGIKLPSTLNARYGAGDAQKWMEDFKSQPGWQEIQNGKGMPSPGDVIVLADKHDGWGHVAIVTKVEGGKVWFAQGNARSQFGSFPIDSTTGYTDPSVLGTKWSVLGYIRYAGGS